MISLITLTLFAGLVLVACGTASPTTEQAPSNQTATIEGFTYYGDIPSQPERVVSLSAYDTGYLVKLGLNVVGVTPLDKDNQALAEHIKEAKAVSSTDLEAITELNPDVIVILSTDENIEQLAKIAPVIAVDYGTHDYLQLMTDFGQVFNKEDQAKDWLANWQEQTATTGEQLKAAIGEDTTFTIVQFFGDSLYLRGDDGGRGGEILYQAMNFSAPDKVLEDVFEAGFLALSPEVIGDYAGDYIILSAPNADTGSILEDTDVWNKLDAVKNNRVITLDDNTFAYNDPITLEHNLEELTRLLLDTVTTN